MTLKDFVPADGAAGWDYGSDFLATLKTNGNLDKKYGYLSPYWAKKYFEEDQAGWYDYGPLADEEFDDSNSQDDAVIPFGTGVLIYTAGDGVTVTFAGEVIGDDVAVALNENANTFTGNASPADLTLKDLEPTDGAAGWDYGSDFLATLKTNGNLDQKFGYLSPYWANKYFEDNQTGWYDYGPLADEEFDESNRKDAFKISAGQSFLVYTAGAAVELVIPSPL